MDKELEGEIILKDEDEPKKEEGFFEKYKRLIKENPREAIEVGLLIGGLWLI